MRTVPDCTSLTAVTAMRLSPIPALLSVLLLAACGQAVAVESRQMSADGSGSCPESAASSERIDGAESDPNAPASPVKRSSKAKAAAAQRAGGGNRSNAPRWHSFLPGMFR